MSGGSDALIGSRAIVVATRFAECSPECEPAAAAGAAAAEAAGGVGLQLSMLRLCVGDGGSGASGGGGAGGEPSSSIGLERHYDDFNDQEMDLETLLTDEENGGLPREDYMEMMESEVEVDRLLKYIELEQRMIKKAEEEEEEKKAAKAAGGGDETGTACSPAP